MPRTRWAGRSRIPPGWASLPSTPTWWPTSWTTRCSTAKPSGSTAPSGWARNERRACPPPTFSLSSPCSPEGTGQAGRAAGVPGHGDRPLRLGLVEQGGVSGAHPAQARRAGAEHTRATRLQQPVRGPGHRRDDARGHVDRHVFPGPPRPVCGVALRLRLGRPEGAAARRTPSSLRITGAFALTEPGHGSDVAGGMETRARRISSATGEPDDDGDAWVLNGAKRWIGNGTFCDYMLVWARDESAGADGPARSAGSLLMRPCRG